MKAEDMKSIFEKNALSQTAKPVLEADNSAK